jgi:hypothetical protein
MRHEDGWHLLNLCGKWPFATTQHNPTFLVERVLTRAMPATQTEII